MELKFVFLIILAFVSTVYLVTLFFKFSPLQAVLKGCLLPLILAVYIFGTDRVLLPIVLALVFGWLGDIFLLKISDDRFFKLGLGSFLAGHLCFIAAMYNFAQPFNFPILFICIAAAAVLGFFMFRFVQPNEKMRIPVIAYEIIIMFMAVSAIQIFVNQGSYFGIFVLAGSLCFVLSDTILAFDTFRKKTNIGHFVVMLTYILAQLFIILGFSYTGYLSTL